MWATGSGFAGFLRVVLQPVLTPKQHRESAGSINQKKQIGKSCQGFKRASNGAILRDLVPKNCCEITLQGELHENRALQLFTQSVVHNCSVCRAPGDRSRGRREASVASQWLFLTAICATVQPATLIWGLQSNSRNRHKTFSLQTC